VTKCQRPSFQLRISGFLETEKDEVLSGSRKKRIAMRGI